jgi:HEAT repeat protein
MRETEDLIKQLKHDDWSVRYNAVEMLGQKRDNKAVEALISLLGDKNRLVRQETAIALEKIGDKVAIEPLKKAVAQEKNEFALDAMKRAVETLG